jgi:hypothetical protein
VLSGDKWSPVAGTADDSGFFARFQLDNLPERLQVLHTHLPHDGMHVQADLHPVIRNIQPTAIEEGDTVAVLVEGANFVPGLTAVTALIGPGGAVDPRLECRGVAISRTGTRLGVTVHVSTLTELPEGEVSGHVLRVQTPVGSEEFALPVIGHDELRVPAGSTVTLAQSGRFSELLIEAGGTLNIASRVPPRRLPPGPEAHRWEKACRSAIAAGELPILLRPVVRVDLPLLGLGDRRPVVTESENAPLVATAVLR